MIDIAKELKNLVEKPIDPALFPIEKNDTIFIGNCSVVKKQSNWAVLKNKKTKLVTQTKTAAIAAAHRLLTHRPQLGEIARLDNVISKNINDCVFYKNYLKTSRKTEDLECVSIRLEDSTLRIKDARDKLESFIYPRAKYKQ